MIEKKFNSRKITENLKGVLESVLEKKHNKNNKDKEYKKPSFHNL